MCPYWTAPSQNVGFLFFFLFFYRSFQIFTCREKKKEKLFFFAWFLSYVSCTNEKKEEVQGEVHLVQFNRAAGDGSSQRRRGGGGLDIYMYIYFLYVYPPTHLTDPQQTSKTLFVCVCVYLLGSWRLSHLDRENPTSRAAARVYSNAPFLFLFFNNVSGQKTSFFFLSPPFFYYYYYYYYISFSQPQPKKLFFFFFLSSF